MSELDELKSTVARHDQELRALAGIVSQGFETLTELMVVSFKSLETRFQSLETRFVSLETRFVSLETRFQSLETGFQSLDGRFQSIDARFQSLETKMDSQYQDLRNLITRTQSDNGSEPT